MKTYKLIPMFDGWCVARFVNDNITGIMTCVCKRKENALRIAEIKGIHNIEIS